MRFAAAISGDLRQHMAQEIAAAEAAVTSGIRLAGAGLKADWRGQVISAGLGDRLARTIRDQYYPKGRNSIAAATVVYSRASQIVAAFDRGVIIRSKNGFWLAIPTPAAGKGFRGARITPAQWEQRTGMRLIFIYRRNGPSLLVAQRARIAKSGKAVASRSKTGRGQVSAIIFYLVPQVTLRKRLDLGRDARAWEAKLPELIAREWRN